MRAALDDCRRDLRGPEYGFLASYCRRRLRLVGAHEDAVTSLALSADGKRLFSGSHDKTIKVWDLEAGKETLTLRGHTDAVSSLALSADGKRLFSGSCDQTIKVWDLEAGKETLTLRGHTGGVSSLALSADGKRLFSGSCDQTIKVWDLFMLTLQPVALLIDRSYSLYCVECGLKQLIRDRIAPGRDLGHSDRPTHN